MTKKITIEQFTGLVAMHDLEISETERVLESLESLELMTYGPYQIVRMGLYELHQRKQRFLAEYGISYEIPSELATDAGEIMALMAK